MIQGGDQENERQISNSIIGFRNINGGSTGRGSKDVGAIK